MRILVTGGCGFIGSHLTDELVRCEHQVTVFDRAPAPSHGNPKAEYIVGDICDQLDSLIANWQTLEASSIKPYRKSGLSEGKITAGLEDGSKLEFLLMAISPEIVIARPDLGLQYHFSESQYYGLLAVAQE